MAKNIRISVRISEESYEKLLNYCESANLADASCFLESKRDTIVSPAPEKKTVKEWAIENHESLKRVCRMGGGFLDVISFFNTNHDGMWRLETDLALALFEIDKLFIGGNRKIPKEKFLDNVHFNKDYIQQVIDKEAETHHFIKMSFEEFKKLSFTVEEMLNVQVVTLNTVVGYTIANIAFSLKGYIGGIDAIYVPQDKISSNK